MLFSSLWWALKREAFLTGLMGEPPGQRVAEFEQRSLDLDALILCIRVFLSVLQ